MLAKNAEDRYQTAYGLKFDLETCLHQWQTTGQIIPFPLGQRDRGNQLLIPQKLYGRESEIALLMEAFYRVAGKSETATGQSELMLVSGYSGIGKTSIVNEVHKPMVEARGYFIAGKFDQFKRNIPYAALIQAFQELLRQLLTESEAQVSLWKTKLLEALGTNAQIIIDVIPELELIIGSQPEVTTLGASETQNRFNRVFREFLGVFCQKEHPLVIFLDDLQWADSASLNLIHLLMTDENSRYLLMIGAYRDNEVNAAHPLVKTLEKIQAAGTLMHAITVQPLPMDCVRQLVSETLTQPPDSQQVTALVELLFNKTQGNPFFLTQILKTLYIEKLLVYQVETDTWQWDIQQIQTVGITDYNVVELIARNILQLPIETQNVLKLAACIGNQFNLDILAIVYKASEFITASQLWEALQSGLILPLSTSYKIPLAFGETGFIADRGERVKVGYRFLHDRVQQAIYSLIPDGDKKATHLKIGQLLLENISPEERKENIFALVNQLNFGIDLLTSHAKRRELAELNLLAGQKAKSATAYSAAVKYLQSGLQLLPKTVWKNHYPLARDLHTEAVEATYLNTDFEEAERLSNIVLKYAKTPLEKVKIYEIKVQFNIAQNQMQTAIDVGLYALELLNISLSESPPQVEDISQLYNLPLMESSEKLEAMRVLMILYAPA
ncbi:AAA family ATPase [Geitlerinema splendidum]|nr:AAA family ATPase [Geitlerinema splendidum]